MNNSTRFGEGVGSRAIVMKQLDAMQTTLNAMHPLRRLSEEHRDELRLTRQVLLKGIFEAMEVSTPTTFVVLNEELPALTTEQQSWITKNVVFKDDGSGVEIKGKEPTWFLEWNDRGKDFKTYLEERYNDGKGWVDQLTNFIDDPKEALKSKGFFGVIKDSFQKLITKDELYFYLVDELTGEPIRAPGYPIVITEPSEIVSKLLPVMQVGIRAMSVYNGVAGVAQMFGYPLPKVPKKLREGAQSSVDSLKQESSVEAFGAIHEKAKDKDEKKESVRGASLRELKKFFEAQREPENYAGLRRIGDPNDGTAVWTRLTDPKEVKDALEKRAKERNAEQKRGEADYATYLREKAAGDADAAAGGGARADNASDATVATTAGPAAGSGPSAVRALTAAPRDAGDPEALRRVEDRLTGIEEQLGAIRSIEAAMSRSLLRLSQ